VVYASKPAALWPTAMKVYQSFCWRGVGTGRSMAGLSGAPENGLIAMELDSAVASDLARGASGSATVSLEDSEATVFAAAGESVAADLGRSEFGSHIKRRAADSNKEHLSIAGRVDMRWAATWEA
jgi:hypothetical protein